MKLENNKSQEMNQEKYLNKKQSIDLQNKLKTKTMADQSEKKEEEHNYKITKIFDSGNYRQKKTHSNRKKRGQK